MVVGGWLLSWQAFAKSGTAFRPLVIGNPDVRSGDRIWNPDAFGLMPLGADVQNIMNHPLLSPEDMSISSLGNFSMQVNPTTLKPEIASVTPNPDFGRLISSFSQDGVESRRTIRLRLRITF